MLTTSFLNNKETLNCNEGGVAQLQDFSLVLDVNNTYKKEKMLSYKFEYMTNTKLLIIYLLNLIK